MLDRIIGFRLSKLMQSKTGGKSAGRVQSVALKLIVDREREIEAFKMEDYYEIDASFDEFSAKLDSFNHEKIERISTEDLAKEIISKLSDEFVIESIDKQEKNKKAKAPFITSTLQQDASTKLNFNGKKTMMIAQKLYEGVSLENETVGLITYMRTDSIRLSDEFVKSSISSAPRRESKRSLSNSVSEALLSRSISSSVSRLVESVLGLVCRRICSKSLSPLPNGSPFRASDMLFTSL